MAAATTAAVALSGGSAAITLPAGTFPVGTGLVSASYVPDAASSSLYSNATGSSSVTVGKATPILTWATPAPIVYGAALSAVQLDATASVPGTFAYTPGMGSRAGAWQPDPSGSLHANRHDELHHGHG